MHESYEKAMQRFKAMESGDIIEKTGSLQAALGKPMVVFYKD